MKIVIAGGTGFIGQSMIKYFGEVNQVIVLTRNLPGQKTNAYGQHIDKSLYPKVQYLKWDGQTLDNWSKELEKTDVLINLSGKSVNCRYTEKNKQEIISSRINSTKILGLAIQQCTEPPKLWINAGSATIYRDAYDHAQDELTGEYKNDFSVQVCKLWEKMLFDQRTPFTRKIVLRMAITLGKGGVMKPYLNLIRIGLGGKQGTGKQMYSWIHIEETCRIIEWLFANEELEGAFNCSSPEPITNNHFMHVLRHNAGVPFGLPTPVWMLKMGARLIGTETELLLKSRWVIPTRLLNSGYHFKYLRLEDAVKNILDDVS